MLCPHKKKAATRSPHEPPSEETQHPTQSVFDRADVFHYFPPKRTGFVSLRIASNKQLCFHFHRRVRVISTSSPEAAAAPFPTDTPDTRSMKFGIALLATLASMTSGADGFAAGVRKTSRVAPLREKMAEELGTPCEDECALESFPNLPPSVHPGVVTGQAMIDLLDHAKENGEFGCVGLGARKGCVCIGAGACSVPIQVH